MKYRIFLSAIVLLIYSTIYLLYEETNLRRCSGWLTQAGKSNDQGYYSEAIEQLTLYFSNDKCRTASDAGAIKILTEARLHVPLPQNTHLGQQLELAKLGWKLKRDNRYHLMEASAALVRGKWVAARTAARKLKTAQAGLIALTASIRLSDTESAKEDLKWIAQTNATPFQWAMLKELLADMPALKGVAESKMPATDSNLRQLALLSTGKKNTAMPAASISKIKNTLTDDDLSTATSLLIAEGQIELAKLLLDQPNRALAAPHLTRYARLLWAQQEVNTLFAFLDRSSRGAMPGAGLFQKSLGNAMESTRPRLFFTSVSETGLTI